jgi:hypothetical protein
VAFSGESYFRQQPKFQAIPNRISWRNFPVCQLRFHRKNITHEQTAALSFLRAFCHAGFQHHRFHGDVANGYADIQRNRLEGYLMAAYGGIMVACLHFSQ